MVPVTGKYNHLVTSFGLKALAPVYELIVCTMWKILHRRQ